jgi:hypothetical protein
MLDSEASKRRSDQNENIVKKQFEKLGYRVKPLDSPTSKTRTPDFLISNSFGPQLLFCEVKTVDSGGFARDENVYGVKDVHISTLDKEFLKPGRFKNIRIDLRKIDEGLASAIDKRREFVGHNQSFVDLPLLVAFFFDRFAEYLPFYPRSFDQRDECFREVSGILTIEHDIERTKALEKLSDVEQERRLKAEAEGNVETNEDLPPCGTDFVLLRNEAASRPVPEDFARLCSPA